MKMMTQATQRIATCTLVCMLAAACSDDDSNGNNSNNNQPPPPPPVQAQYVMGMTVTGDPTIAFVKLFEEFPTGRISLDDAIELGEVFPYVHDGRVFTLDRSDGTVVRYRVDGLSLVEDGEISFAARGGADDIFFVSETRAFAFNSNGREFVEFDPTAGTMVITSSVSVAAVDETPFGTPSLFRRAFVRESDNTVFSVINYPLQGPISIDETFLLATNVDSKATTIIRDERCPVSSAFGLNAGFFNQADDFFFLSDAGLGINAVLGLPGAKDPCVIRIPNGTLAVDTDFDLLPRDQTDGRFVVGLVPLGNGLAFTNAFDITGATPETAFDAFTEAQVEYWIVDTTDQSMRKIDVPEDDKAVNGFNVDGRRFVVRLDLTASGGGTITIDDNVLLEIDPANDSVTEVLRVQANLFVLERL